MTLNPSLPDLYQWHTSKTKPCPMCGLTRYVGRNVGGYYEHRAVHPNEGRLHKWARRALVTTKRDKAGVIRYLYADGQPSRTYQRNPDGKNPGNCTDLRGKRGQHGVTRQTRDRIVKATSLLANGHTYDQVALILEVQPHAIVGWQVDHPGLWRQCYDSAMQTARETVRQLAGTDGILADIDAYMLAAARADDWSRARSEPLFDRGDALTLPRFYREHYQPLRPMKASSHHTDVVILRRWALLTGDPALSEVTGYTLSNFRDALAKMRGARSVKRMSANTIRGYMGRVQTWIDKAGPSGRHNRDALELISKAPWAKPPNKLRRIPKIVADEVINNFYLGCIAADRPTSPHFKPAAWWRAFIVLLYNTGLRRGTAFEIRMSWINWQRRCIAIPAEQTKTGNEQLIPLHPVVIEHLQAIRGDREFLFEWNCRKFGLNASRHFYSYFHKLQTECGIPVDQHFGLHQLRKTCATVLWQFNPAAAQFALGHTSMDTTMGHYVQSQDLLARAVQQMPQPSAFGGKDGAI